MKLFSPEKLVGATLDSVTVESLRGYQGGCWLFDAQDTVLRVLPSRPTRLATPTGIPSSPLQTLPDDLGPGYYRLEQRWNFHLEQALDWGPFSEAEAAALARSLWRDLATLGAPHGRLRPVCVLHIQTRWTFSEAGFEGRGDFLDPEWAGYVSPELLQGRPLCSQDDTWSLAVMLHQVICGVLPFPSTTPAGITADVLSGELKLHHGLSEEWAELLRACLGPDRPDPAGLVARLDQMLAQTGVEIITRGYRHCRRPTRAVGLSHDHQWLGWLEDDGHLRLKSLPERKVVWWRPQVQSFVFSTTEELMVLRDQHRRVFLLQLPSGRELWQVDLPTHPWQGPDLGQMGNRPTCLIHPDPAGPQFSPDGETIAVPDGWLVRFFNRQGEPLGECRSQGEVCAVAFSPDGAVLATSGWDRVLRIWDTSTYEQSHSYLWRGHEMAFTPDGMSLWTGWADQLEELDWELDAPPRTPPTGAAVALTCLAQSPDGRRVAWFDRLRGCLTVSEGRVHQRVDCEPIKAMVFALDGHRLLTASEHGVTTWSVQPLPASTPVQRRPRVESPRGLLLQPHPDWLEFSLSADLKTRVVRQHDRVVVGRDGGEREIEGGFDRMQISADGRWLALLSQQRLDLWDLVEWELNRVDYPVCDLSFGGDCLAVIGWNAAIVDLSRQQIVLRLDLTRVDFEDRPRKPQGDLKVQLPPPVLEAGQVRLSPDGRRLWLARAGRAYLWDRQSGWQQVPEAGHAVALDRELLAGIYSSGARLTPGDQILESQRFRYVEVHPQGRFFGFSGDGPAVVWDGKEGREVWRNDHAGHLRFTTGGDLMLVSSQGIWVEAPAWKS